MGCYLLNICRSLIEDTRNMQGIDKFDKVGLGTSPRQRGV